MNGLPGDSKPRSAQTPGLQSRNDYRREVRSDGKAWTAAQPDERLLRHLAFVTTISFRWSDAGRSNSENVFQSRNHHHCATDRFFCRFRDRCWKGLSMAGSLLANCGGKEKVRISPASAKRFRSFYHHQRQLPWKDTRFVGCGAMPGHGLMLTDPARPNTRKRIQESLRTFWLCNASHCATCWRTPALQDSALELQFNVFPTVKFHTYILGYWALCRSVGPFPK